MRKVYESPEAQVVSFEAMEQLALLTPQDSNDNVGENPGTSGSVGDRGDY